MRLLLGCALALAVSGCVKTSAEVHPPNGLSGRPSQPHAHAIRDRALAGGEAHLKVATSVIGYSIQTEDGTIGHVQDVLVDDQAWAIRYLLVDTTGGWTGQRVLVAPDSGRGRACLVSSRSCSVT